MRSRFLGDNFFESVISGSWKEVGRITAAETTGPARGPRPASSIPAISLQPFLAASFSKYHKSMAEFGMRNAEVEKQKSGAGDKQQVTRDRHNIAYC